VLTVISRTAAVAFWFLINCAEAGVPAAIQVDGLRPGTTATVVLVGVGGRDCSRNKVVAVHTSGRLSLTSQLREECWKCSAGDLQRPRVAVFARGRAAVHVRAESLCSSAESTLHVSMKERRPLAVRVWVSKDRERAARDEIVNADWILDKNRTGLALHAEVKRLGDGNTIVDDCDPARNKQFFDPAVMNVFFATGSNRACRGDPIIFTSTGGGVLGDLAHEIGHMLGLHKSDHEFEYDQGHTNGIRGFDCSNTLWSTSSILDHTLSLGQASWMNVSDSSFAASREEGLTCATEPGKPSPCVTLATGNALPRGQQCRPCSEAQVKRLLAARPDHVNQLSASAAQHCTIEQVTTLLSRRHEALVQHAAENGMQLGSPSREDFVARWKVPTAVGTIATAVTATRDGKKRADYIALLRNALNAKEGLYLNNEYLVYIIRKLEKGQPATRCDIK
jgi:hypothetical protein